MITFNQLLYPLGDFAGKLLSLLNGVPLELGLIHGVGTMNHVKIFRIIFHLTELTQSSLMQQKEPSGVYLHDRDDGFLLVSCGTCQLNGAKP